MDTPDASDQLPRFPLPEGNRDAAGRVTGEESIKLAAPWSMSMGRVELEGLTMKGKINCYLCQRAIAEHRRGELCWLNALATGAAKPLVSSWPPAPIRQSMAPRRFSAAN